MAVKAAKVVVKADANNHNCRKTTLNGQGNLPYIVYRKSNKYITINFKEDTTMTKLQLKVKRGELAKEFPMLKIAKAGDVGLDIAVAFPYKDGYEDAVEAYLAECSKFDETPDDDFINELKHGVVVIKPGERYLCPTDIKIEIPEGYWASIEARSSTSKKSIIVPKGVIDEGYRGELFAQLINVGKHDVVIHHGDRLIQLIMHERHIKNFDVIEVDELSESERGETGFGSSGQSAIKR